MLLPHRSTFNSILEVCVFALFNILGHVAGILGMTDFIFFFVNLTALP